jgi:hypothetical protein
MDFLREGETSFVLVSSGFRLTGAMSRSWGSLWSLRRCSRGACRDGARRPEANLRRQAPVATLDPRAPKGALFPCRAAGARLQNARARLLCRPRRSRSVPVKPWGVTRDMRKGHARSKALPSAGRRSTEIQCLSEIYFKLSETFSASGEPSRFFASGAVRLLRRIWRRIPGSNRMTAWRPTGRGITPGGP